MKHATDVRGSALIAAEVTMLRSQADVKFDTGDKEESGCLRANLAQGPPWVLVPSEPGAEEEHDSTRLLATTLQAQICLGKGWRCDWGLSPTGQET
jgi:hypothetical protein